MKLFFVLVAFTVIFASCGSSPGVDVPRDSGHALPPRTGHVAPVLGDPIEQRAVVKFPDGSVDEYTESFWNEVIKTQLDRQERNSASGILVEEIKYTYYEENREGGTKGELSDKTTLDDSNRRKSRIVYNYREGTPNLIKETFVDRKGKIVSSFDYTYDGEGNMLTRVINNASGAKLTETIYTYRDGRVIQSETRDSAGRKISSARNEYDAAGNLIKQTVYNASDRPTRIIQAEWQNGKEVKNEQLSPNGQIQLRTVSEYGAQGELIKKTIENIEGDSKQILEFEYNYGQSNSRTKAK
ncbi:hypothetical protein AGMMS49928_17920 [Spirochaetia bacterium]|nr:hypothetical protein AGMMS49928_17920 [Spirochaetia bacterium]